MSSTELQRLATIERNEGKEELRISVDEFTDDRGKAHQYVSVRLWFKGDGDKWLPTKKGLTIRKSEIMAVGVALKTALGVLNDQPAQQSERMPPRQPTAPRSRPANAQNVEYPDGSDPWNFNG